MPKHQSLWLSTSEIPSSPRLTGEVRADVAVIGGGMVGVLCAWEMIRRGRSVVVVEGRRLLHGVTGNTTAKVSASHGSIYGHIQDQFGEDAARLYGRANLEAIDWIERTAMEEDIDCQFRRRDLYLYAENEEARSAVQSEQQAAERAGLPCELVGHIDTPFPSFGAARFPNQAEFHPVRFLSALIHSARDKGCQFFEHTMASEVDEDEAVEVTTTDGGRIVADDVIIASHFPFFDPAFYYARLEPFRDYAVAGLLRKGSVDAMFVGSNEGYTVRSQPSPDGEWVIVSGGTHKVGKDPDTRRYYDELIAWTERTYPVAGISHEWSTQDNGTVDRVPYIGRISTGSEHVYVATGFGGWGMAHSVVAAQLIGDLINGRTNRYTDLYAPTRFKPITSAPTMAKIGVDSVKGLVGERLSGGADGSPTDLAPGKADVFKTDDGRVAAYRAEDGRLHAVSAACTHMGCIVNWNPAEKSWDCPCHGSRFGFTGEVLHGPAVTPLESIEEGDRVDA